MANGGKRPGAGRKKGCKNRATIARETKQAAVIAQMVDSDRPLAIMDLQRAMEFAEGAVAAYRPTLKSELARGMPKNEKGDIEEFGKWFDRWLKCITILAEYQSPKMRAMDAPTRPPDAGPRRFTLNIFDHDGKRVGGSDEAAT
jgi:hypothetical protein